MSWKILAELLADPGQCGKAEGTPQTTCHPPTTILMSFLDFRENTVGYYISMGGQQWKDCMILLWRESQSI